MSSRRSIVVVESFYRDPDAIRDFALKQKFYTPYEEQAAATEGRIRATWWASCFKKYNDCVVKSSNALTAALEQATGEEIDQLHWQADYPVGADSKPLKAGPPAGASCLWNCCFHVKPENGQKLGDGVHNHVTDGWNSVGPDGWAGLLYLNRLAPLDGGLYLWRNKRETANFDWMTARENWQLVDTLANLYNRLVLVRGDVPHSGAGGWGDSLETGRMYQTFFFRTIRKQSLWPVAIPRLERA
jgi:hypothetical protein